MNVLRLQRLTDRVQIIPGPTMIGLILLGDDRVAVIDSGLDRRAGRRLYELLRDYQYRLDVILNTHAHADHIGGNSFLHRTTHCRIMAGPLEVPVIRHPLIQAVTLFGGAPPNELQNRILTADPSPAEAIRGDSLQFDDLKIDVIPLPGHSIGQVGFVVDGVAFLADALFAPQVMEKHKLVYMYDPGQQRQTLTTLKNLKARTFVGGHFMPTPSIEPLIQSMTKHLDQAFAFLKQLLSAPHPIDRLVKDMLGHFGIKHTGWAHFLYRSTVMGYLSTLKRNGEADYKIMDNLPVWYSVSRSA